MLSQNIKRCPHFQLHSEQLGQGNPAAYLAIRHCTLTARLLRLLETAPDSMDLTQRLVIRIDESHAYAFVGPDLEAVTQQACSTKRCDQDCTPAYKQTLALFAISDPELDTVTCEEEASTDKSNPTGSEVPSSPCC